MMFDGKKTEDVTPADLDKQTGKEMAKYFGWVCLIGCCITKAARHYATAFSCKLVSDAMKEKEKENSGKTE